MTIGIGLATREYVVLAADSAVTHGDEVRQPLSSLGEMSDATRGVEEAALKIVPLGTHAAATIAGTAHDALDALAWIKPHVAADDFEKMWADAMSVKTHVSFEILVARWQREAPELYRCIGRHAERVRLKAGLIAAEAEPGMPRLDRALSAWESALATEPALIGWARFAATKHPDTPEIAQRLLAAVKAIEGSA